MLISHQKQGGEKEDHEENQVDPGNCFILFHLHIKALLDLIIARSLKKVND